MYVESLPLHCSASACLSAGWAAPSMKIPETEEGRKKFPVDSWSLLGQFRHGIPEWGGQEILQAVVGRFFG